MNLSMILAIPNRVLMVVGDEKRGDFKRRAEWQRSSHHQIAIA